MLTLSTVVGKGVKKAGAWPSSRRGQGQEWDNRVEVDGLGRRGSQPGSKTNRHSSRVGRNALWEDLLNDTLELTNLI